MLQKTFKTETEKGLAAYHGLALSKILRNKRLKKGWSQERLAEEANEILRDGEKPWIVPGFQDTMDRFYIIYLEKSPPVAWASKTRLRAVTTALEIEWLEVLEAGGLLYESDFA